MKSSNFVCVQLSSCRNEKLMTLFFFFSCSLPLCFLLLEPWSSSKWVLLCAPCDLQWQKRGKLPIKGYNCRNNRIKISSSSSTCYPSLCGSGNVISLCRLPHQTGFPLHGLQKLKHREADRQVMCCLAMLLMVAALRLVNVNGSEELISGCYLQVGWAICIQFLALLQKSF